MKSISVTLYLNVHDEKAFAAAARKRAIADGLSVHDARAYNTAHLDDCARMLFDPGVSPDGCDIMDSAAEVYFAGRP